MRRDLHMADGTAPAPGFAEAMEAAITQEKPKEDQALCNICMQWACDGPHCHRDDVCPDEKSTA